MPQRPYLYPHFVGVAQCGNRQKWPDIQRLLNRRWMSGHFCHSLNWLCSTVKVKSQRRRDAKNLNHVIAQPKVTCDLRPTGANSTDAEIMIFPSHHGSEVWEHGTEVLKNHANPPRPSMPVQPPIRPLRGPTAAARTGESEGQATKCYSFVCNRTPSQES